MRPELIMKSIIPVVMAGIIAIYGLVVAVLIAGTLGRAPKYDLYKYVFFVWHKTQICHYDIKISVHVKLRIVLQYSYNYINVYRVLRKERKTLIVRRRNDSVINEDIFLLLC